MSESVVKTTWRSLEEFADTPEFRRWADREFPALAAGYERAVAVGSPTRRRFLQLMGASMALAGLTGCHRRPDHRILPMTRKPSELAPGLPLYYATSLVAAGRPVGVLAETHEGRPTKLEGHPDHPASRGALGTHAQAAVLELYDPDRSRFVVHDGRPAGYEEDFLPALDALRGRLAARDGGRGLAVLTGRAHSPADERLRARLAAALPESTWHVWEPLDLAGDAGPLDWEARPDLDGARVILALDADPLGLEDDGVRHRAAWARGRGGEPDDPMNRLYAVEPHLTVTGMAADHRLALPAHRVRDYALLLAREIAGGPGGDAALDRLVERCRPEFPGDPRWLREVAADLRAHRGACVVLAGRGQPPIVHHLARWIHERLDGRGTFVARRPDPTLADLADRIGRDEVDTLVVLGSNPVYDAPADLAFDRLLDRVDTTIHLGLYRDETGARCTWHVPGAHPLESWGDTRSGRTLAPTQPMIEPLLGGRTRLELLARLAGEETSDPYELARASFRELTGDDAFDRRWRRFLHEGRVELPDDGRAAPAHDLASLPLDGLGPVALPDGDWELVFSADESMLDGRHANHAWLQECPDPVTKLVWDNAAILSPGAARELGVSNGDFLGITFEGRSLDLPAFVVPGGAERSIRLPLGYGRRTGGALLTHAGFDTYRLRSTGSAGFAVGARVVRGGGRHELATTQEHWSIESHELIDGVLRERAIVRSGTRAEFRENPGFAREMGLHVPHHRDIAERPPFTGDHQWGMVIDLNRCLGCTACTVACQAENNIPVVGPDEVRRGREMHWMRIDRYFRGADPFGEIEVDHQPMLCQHCENAPCEPVCPVNATVHDEEGLNVMAYNRCIGTRYCSNNCPYKVRRFNWYDWNKGTLRQDAAPFDQANEPTPIEGFSEPQPFQPDPAVMPTMQHNPDVTVRMRGVMEKCTFCTQRIQAARIAAKVEAGQTRADKVADGTLLTACQQSCPTGAIVFGDVSDPDSRVSRLKRQPREYGVLDHLNTRPRLTYLARLRNPNPAMPEPAPAAGPDAPTGEQHG